MPYQHFSIWDKELDVFLDNVKESGIQDVDAWKKWFYEAGTYSIHKHEVATLVEYTKTFLKENKRFPDMSGIGLGGYMFQVLQLLRDEFITLIKKTFKDIDDDNNTLFTLESDFALLIDAALANHREFYEWRAELNSVKLNEYITVTDKHSINQTAFVEDAIAKALESAELSVKLRADLENYRIFIREINANLTPMTKRRGMYVEKTDSQGKRISPQTSPDVGKLSPNSRESRNGMQNRFKDPTQGSSPLSIHRTLYNNKTPSSRTATDDKEQDKETVEASLHRALGFKSSSQ